MKHAQRKTRLETLLIGRQALWRPQPFKIETPDWCAEHPALTAELLALDDDAVDALAVDNPALIGLLAGHVAELAELAGLIDLPPAPASDPSPLVGPARRAQDATQLRSRAERGMGRSPTEGGAQRRVRGELRGRLYTDIPGRKQDQIDAYAAAIGEPHAPLLEWCAGKGHLGRLLAHRWHWPVASLEIDADLCAAGENLARRIEIDCMQQFIRADALAPESARHLAGRHAVALHACGDLHTRLIAGAAAGGSPAIDLAPCCYYRIADTTYRPFAETPLALASEDLRLAVTETATASAKQRRQSRRALAWKLGWVELRKRLLGDESYRSFPPVPEAWLRGDFSEFARRMIEREIDATGFGDIDLAGFEIAGHTRAARMLRLQLVRLAFRRPLEVWLLMDMAVYLERHGYRVEVGPFCPPSLTPRNLLLSARRG